MPKDTILVSLSTDNTNTETFKEIIRFTEGFDILNPTDKRRPDLLILELGDKVEAQFALIESLLEKKAVGEIFLTSDKVDPGLLRRAMRLGVKEFFPQPIPVEEVKHALEGFRLRHTPSTSGVDDEQSCKILHVTGSKGGVGTTTAAVNLAVNLAKRKSRPSVVLVDMNFVSGEIPVFLDIHPKYHWGEISRNIDRLDNTFLASVMTKHSSGLDVLASPHSLSGNERATPEIARHILMLLKEIYRFIVVDTGHSTDETSLAILEMADHLLLLCILSLPCLANTRKLLHSYKELGYPKEHINVIANRCLKKSDIALKDAEEAIGQDFFFVLPNDYYTTMTAINLGKPLIDLAPKAEISNALKRLTDTLIPPDRQKASKGRQFLRFLKR
ncbi:AAA family ATPase [Desulfatiglans anilini]|uniref:AAA family ATPase n=1 Tax=Desulfatiglans anilini TaxID=90728 RepID=UPI00040DFD99|nr:AAA family ATPase [Desulfatiglans anilini]